MKKMQGFAIPVILVYLWVMMILLSAIVLETFMVYPNIFHDPPGPLKPAWSSCPSERRATSSLPSAFSLGSLV